MKQYLAKIFLWCQFGILVALLSGCATTTSIPVTIREPEKWNEARAFKVINDWNEQNEESLSSQAGDNVAHNNHLVLNKMRRSDNAGLYARTRSEPFITKGGVLHLSTKTLHTEFFNTYSIERFNVERKRIPLDVQHVEFQRERMHWWQSYWTYVVHWFTPPVTDNYLLSVSGEKRLASWRCNSLQAELWQFFPFWLIRPLHYVNNPKHQEGIREAAEAFEWLRLNGRYSSGTGSFAEQNHRLVEAKLQTESRPVATPLPNAQISITLQSDGNADVGAVLESGAALAKFLTDAGNNSKSIPSTLLDAAVKAGITEKAMLDAIQKAVFVAGAGIAFSNPVTFGGATVNSVTRERFVLTLNQPGGKGTALTHTVDFADVTGLRLRTDKDGKENGIVLLKGPAPIFAFDFTDDKTRDDYLAALMVLCVNLQTATE